MDGGCPPPPPPGGAATAARGCRSPASGAPAGPIQLQQGPWKGGIPRQQHPCRTTAPAKGTQRLLAQAPSIGLQPAEHSGPHPRHRSQLFEGVPQAIPRSPQWRSRALRRLQPTPGQPRQTSHQRRRHSPQPMGLRRAPEPNGTSRRSPNRTKAIHMYSTALAGPWAPAPGARLPVPDPPAGAAATAVAPALRPSWAAEPAPVPPGPRRPPHRRH